MTTKRMMATIGYSISAIPRDLTIEILIRLPAKSVFRFRSVSKSWRSIISSQQFINAFMSRPRLILGFHDHDDDRVLFFSTPHQSGSFLSSSSVVVAEKKTLTIPKDKSDFLVCTSVRGFFCCCVGDEFVVCNPTTGQVIPLVEKKDDNYRFSMYLGYDPNSDQYKVLRIMSPKFSNSHAEHSVRTLGGQGSSNLWRSIKISIFYYHNYQNGVCIDGVVYYKCEIIKRQHMISCFDVGSELLSLIEVPEDLPVHQTNATLGFGDLTNYLGKLAVYYPIRDGCRLWILDDVKNQVWSKKTCIFQYFTPSMLFPCLFKGVTSSGEIVYLPTLYDLYDSDSLELLCYDVEKKMEKKVEVEGLSKIGRLIYPFISCSYEENI